MKLKEAFKDMIKEYPDWSFWSILFILALIAICGLIFKPVLYIIAGIAIVICIAIVGFWTISSIIWIVTIIKECVSNRKR